MTEAESIIKVGGAESAARDEAILIVDDDLESLGALRAALEGEGCFVEVAETGAAAVEKMLGRPYVLMLLDDSLPDVGGLQLLQVAERMAPDAVKIMLWGNPDLNEAIEALNRGADHFLLKPVAPNVVLSVVAEKLRERVRGEAPIGKDEVTVILPVLNEEEAIGLVLEELGAEGYHNVLVVDGYSTDKTVDIARDAGATVIMQHGKGKTGALRTAFQEVKTPYLLVMDGDYTYSARDIEKFLPFAKGFDQIFGSRRESGNMSLLHRFGNWVINMALTILFGSGVSDVCSGMYMMKTDSARSLELRSRGFDVEVEAAIQNITYGSVTEVPVSYRERLGRRKLSTWRQGFRILWTVVRMSFSYNPLFFLTALGSLLTLPGASILLFELYLRLRFGEAGWSIGLIWLGLILFILGLNSFTIAMLTLLSKRTERRIVQHIKSIKR